MAVNVSVVLTLFLVHSVLSFVPHHDNAVYFVKRNVFYTTQSKWLSNFLLSFEPYYQYCQTVEVDISHAKLIVTQAIEHSKDKAVKSNLKFDVSKILLLELQHLNIIENDLKQLRQKLTNLHLLLPQPSRSKRSILPFVGNILSNLFGTVGPSDFQNIQQQIQKLAKGQQELNHVLEDSLTIVNVTHIEVSENRKTINQLIDVSRSIKDTLTNITIRMNDRLNSERQFSYFHFQLYNFITLIERSLIMAFRNVDKFQAQVDAVLNHQINPTVVSPNKLQELLTIIQKSLPKTLHLPFHVNTELVKYYQTLSISAVPHSDGLYCIMQIPVLDVTTQYELFEVLNIPMPYPGSNLTAQYVIQHDKFVISSDRTKISFVTENDFAKCSVPFMQFCALDTPIRYINSIKDSCIIAIFSGWNSYTDICNIMVKQTTANYALAYHVVDGKWIITSPTPVTFRMTCPQTRAMAIHISPPMGIIKLVAGCYAISPGLKIPPYFVATRSFELEEPLFMQPTNFSLWGVHNSVMKQAVIHMPDKLADITKNQTPLNELIDHLHSHLDMINTVEVQSHNKSWYTSVISTLVVILVLIVAGSIVYCFCKGKLTACVPKLNSPSINKGLTMSSIPLNTLPAVNPSTTETVDIEISPAQPSSSTTSPEMDKESPVHLY
jgi:hypothetical protein